MVEGRTVLHALTTPLGGRVDGPTLPRYTPCACEEVNCSTHAPAHLPRAHSVSSPSGEWRRLDVIDERILQTEAWHVIALDGVVHEVHIHESPDGTMHHVDVLKDDVSCGRMTFVLGEGISITSPSGEIIRGIDKSRIRTRIGLPNLCEDTWQLFDTVNNPSWGLLANRTPPKVPSVHAGASFDKVPVRATYFFAGSSKRPGESIYGHTYDANTGAYTIRALDYELHENWSESGAKRGLTLDAMLDVNINVVLASSWGPHDSTAWTESAPMCTAPEAVDELFDASVGKPLLVLPALESYTRDFKFTAEFPRAENSSVFLAYAAWIFDLVTAYLGVATPKGTWANAGYWSHKWARIYDKSGKARYAIYIYDPHVDDRPDLTDEYFVDVLETTMSVVEDVLQKLGVNIDIGYTLDTFWVQKGHRSPNHFVPTPEETGAALMVGAERLLAIHPFRPEVSVEFCKSGDREVDFRPDRVDARYADRSYERDAATAWICKDFYDRWHAVGIPIYIHAGTGYYAVLNSTKDSCDAKSADACPPGDPNNQDPEKKGCPYRYGGNMTWLNFLSWLRGAGVKGISYNAWNGFTEGWFGMPCSAVANQDFDSNPTFTDPGKPWFDSSFDDVPNDWIRVVFAQDPRYCNHIHNLVFQVYGAICEKYYEFGGMEGALGDPRSSEKDGALPGSRKNDFTFGGIYWRGDLGASAVYGLIYDFYSSTIPREEGGTLGMPITDEHDVVVMPNWIVGFPARESLFEHGALCWRSGMTHAFQAPTTCTAFTWP